MILLKKIYSKNEKNINYFIYFFFLYAFYNKIKPHKKKFLNITCFKKIYKYY